jgi:uncharacterized protein
VSAVVSEGAAFRPGWLHEIKHDGSALWRAVMARVSGSSRGTATISPRAFHSLSPPSRHCPDSDHPGRKDLALAHCAELRTRAMNACGLGDFNQARVDVLREDINSALKAAMKSGEAQRVSTLRLVNAAILERETRGAERTTLNDAEIVDVMQKMVKQRQEALELYEKAGRSELAAKECQEIEIISAYLPKQMSDIEAARAISTLIKELEAATLKDMGRTMAALKQRFAGQMDFAKAGAQVKKLLGR